MKVSIVCKNGAPIKGAIFIDNPKGAEMMARVLNEEAKSNDQMFIAYTTHEEDLEAEATYNSKPLMYKEEQR